MNALQRPRWYRWWALCLLVLGLVCAPFFGPTPRTAAPSANDALAQAVAASICSTGNAPTADAALHGERSKHCLNLCMGLCAVMPARCHGLTVADDATQGTQTAASQAGPEVGAPSLWLPLSRGPPAGFV